MFITNNHALLHLVSKILKILCLMVECLYGEVAGVSSISLLTLTSKTSSITYVILEGS